MRKIKCKAYIKHLKKLVPVDVIDFLNEEVEVNTSEDGGTSIYRFDEVELLWCTKLTDKNGKEIYEGDIVNLTHMVYAGYGNVDEVTEAVVIEDLTKLPFGPSTITCEVIGNIYENPELLEGEK